METTIIVFLWIVGALCLFVIAFLIYDLIVHAQEKKAQKSGSSGGGNGPAPSKAQEPERKPKENRHSKK